MLEERIIDNGFFSPIRVIMEIPRGQGPFPTVIMCHELSADPIFPISTHPVYSTISKKLANHGFLTVRFKFTMKLEEDIATFHVTSELHDLNKVIEYLMSEERVDNSKIFAEGHSFGGTVLILTAHQNKQIRAIAAMSPKFELHDQYSNHPWHKEAKAKGYFTHKDIDAQEFKISKEFLEENFKHNQKLKKAISRIKIPLLIAYETDKKEEAAESEAIKSLARNARTLPIDKKDKEYGDFDNAIEKVAEKMIEFFIENSEKKARFPWLKRFFSTE